MTRTTIRRVSTFGVSGLTCPDCLVLLMERVRQLPGVREVTVDLEPAGESSLTIAPAEAVSAEEIRALVDEIGFDYIARRSHRRPLRPELGHRSAILASVGAVTCGDAVAWCFV